MAVNRSYSAFTLVEVMVVVLLLGIVMTVSSMVLVTGQELFLDTSSKSEVQASVMQVLHRVSFELQNSGYDSNGVFQVSIQDNAGQNGTDILRFSVPLCLCGKLSFDSVNNVRTWGASLVWQQNGCDIGTYPVGNNGKVDICHFPPGNAQNPNTLNVSLNAVQAHLAHGDYMGDCGACDPSISTNKYIEYLVDVNGRLLRRVLDLNNIVVKSEIMAGQITDFQVVTDGAAKHSAANVKVGAAKSLTRGRVATVTNNVDVLFRNR